MAHFNPEDYESVEERIRRFYKTYEDGRIVTEWVDFAQDEKGPWRYMFKATVFLSTGDQAAHLPKATGYASEIEQGKQAEWAAELAETSAIGRALANMNMSGNKRASREEMEKVQRAEEITQWAEQIAKLTSAEEARNLYVVARSSKVNKNILDAIAEKGKSFDAVQASDNA